MSDTISQFKYRGKEVLFEIDNPKDIIQRVLSHGRFYEIEELEYLATVIPGDSVIADIGSNIGNHAVFFAKIIRARQVFVFEPNPQARRLLERNIELNDLGDRIDTSHLGIAVGNQEGFVNFGGAQTNNLGSQSFQVSEEEAIPMKTIDSLDLPALDFVKVDVEGMEMLVMEGMADTILRDRPVIFIEVRKRHGMRLREDLTRLSYRIERTFQRYRGVLNFVCMPI